MVIFLKTPTGRTITEWVEPSTTIDEVKQFINIRELVPVDLIGLTWAGKRLEDGRTLSDYNIQQDSIIHYVVRVPTSAVATYVDAGLTPLRRAKTQLLRIDTGQKASQRIYGVIGGADVVLGFDLHSAGTLTWTVTYLGGAALVALGSSTGSTNASTGFATFETRLSTPPGTIAVDLVLAATDDAAFIDQVRLCSTAPRVSKPTEPLGLQATPSDGSVHLSWQPPAGSDPTTLGYKISWGSPVQILTCFATSLEIPIPNGTAHRYSVRAIGPGGEGNPAISRSVTPRQATATFLTSDLSTATTADFVTLTANCSMYSGQMTFMVDNRALGTVEVVGATAQFIHRFTRTGNHIVTAILRATTTETSSSDSIAIVINGSR